MSVNEERYSRAVRSSNLACPLDRPAEVDVLIAAGTVRDSIGVDLLRLRTDYDAISGMPGGRRGMQLLRNMAPTRDRLVKFASELAAAKQFDFTADQLLAIVVRVLDLFLDPTCPPCGGTGMLGKHGTVRNTCPHCGGTKRRRLMWESDDAERFVQLIQVKMEEKLDSARLQISQRLRRF